MMRAWRLKYHSAARRSAASSRSVRETRAPIRLRPRGTRREASEPVGRHGHESEPVVQESETPQSQLTSLRWPESSTSTTVAIETCVERRTDLLTEIVGTGPVDDVGSILLPKHLPAFERLAGDRAAGVSALLREGREKVERVERLVCALYGVPHDLTDAVVAHAVERAS